MQGCVRADTTAVCACVAAPGGAVHIKRAGSLVQLRVFFSGDARRRAVFWHPKLAAWARLGWWRLLSEPRGTAGDVSVAGLVLGTGATIRQPPLCIMCALFQCGPDLLAGAPPADVQVLLGRVGGLTLVGRPSQFPAVGHAARALSSARRQARADEPAVAQDGELACSSNALG